MRISCRTVRDGAENSSWGSRRAFEYTRVSAGHPAEFHQGIEKRLEDGWAVATVAVARPPRLR